MSFYREAVVSEMPVISIEKWHGDDVDKRAVASEVDGALCEFGFLLVSDHGVSDQRASLVRNHARTFFDFGEAVKDQYRCRVGSPGWIPPGAEANSYASGVAAPPDLKESYKIGLGMLDDLDTGPKNVWPSEVPELAIVARDYLDQVWELALTLFSIFERSLNLDEGTLRRHSSASSSSMNVNFYPSLRQIGTPEQGQLRIGPHSDFGILTILDRQVGYGGLQIQTLDGGWIDAPYLPGALTINVGDLLSRWTGDRWRSTMHRVLPPSEKDADEALMSLVNFCRVSDSTMVETLPVGGPRTYEPVLAGDYIRSKLQSIDVAD